MYNAIDGVGRGGSYLYENDGVGRGGSYLYENDGVVMTRDPKPRLMWTAELHQQFVDAVTKLGGLDSHFASSGYVHLARQVFDITYKDVLSYTAFIDGYARNALPIRALKLFLEMRRAQVKVDEVVVVAALSHAGTLRCVWFGKYLHGFYVEPGRVSRDVYIGSVRVDMYAKCGFWDNALKVFEDMPYKNLISWTAMIVGSIHCNRFREALYFLRDAIQKACPQSSTY
ncbi:hypothetical protein KY289_036856 [Solanum tuberosum]|nr:hypothetical protein KY289_036856 [Solanum tuberosum]